MNKPSGYIVQYLPYVSYSQPKKVMSNDKIFSLNLCIVYIDCLERHVYFLISLIFSLPVTYFVTYGTAMACYAYFVLTKQDYILPDVKDRQYLISFHRKAKKDAWDVDRYNALREGIVGVERDLK